MVFPGHQKPGLVKRKLSIPQLGGREDRLEPPGAPPSLLLLLQAITSGEGVPTESF